MVVWCLSGVCLSMDGVAARTCSSVMSSMVGAVDVCTCGGVVSFRG